MYWDCVWDTVCFEGVTDCHDTLLLVFYTEMEAVEVDCCRYDGQLDLDWMGYTLKIASLY